MSCTHLAVTACALGLVLAGCTGSSDAPATQTLTSPDAPVLEPGSPGEPNSSLSGTDAVATPTATHNAADVTFLQDMIRHHAQAVVMSEIVEGRLTDAKVTAIASRIADEQEPEMRGMAQTLKRWGEEVPPEADNPKLVTSNHSGHTGMPGMASAQQLAALRQATGEDVDRQYLDLMIAHHEGALEMSETLGAEGRDERTGELADDIHVTQTKQIEQMEEMRQRL